MDVGLIMVASGMRCGDCLAFGAIGRRVGELAPDQRD